MDKPTAIRLLVAASRHLLALGGTATLGAVYAEVLYVCMLGWSVAEGLCLGGLLTPIVMPVFGGLWGLVSGVIAGMPLGLLGEFLLRRRPPRPWHFVVPASILACVLATGLLAILAAGIISWAEGGIQSSRHSETAMVVPWILVPLIAPPLAYWTFLRGLAWLFPLLARRFSRPAPKCA